VKKDIPHLIHTSLFPSSFSSSSSPLASMEIPAEPSPNSIPNEPLTKHEPESETLQRELESTPPPPLTPLFSHQNICL